MKSGIKSRFLTVFIVTSAVLWVNTASAQKVIVDADPAHVANTFSPVRSLGAAIDRLRTGTPDHLLKDPLLKEILGAGWQTVTYRQNTELMVEAGIGILLENGAMPTNGKATSSATPSRRRK